MPMFFGVKSMFMRVNVEGEGVVRSCARIKFFFNFQTIQYFTVFAQLRYVYAIGLECIGKFHCTFNIHKQILES
jgi:hypothetical protein